MYSKEKNKEDILYILNHLRKEDEYECRRLMGDEYKEKILDSIYCESKYFLLGCKKSDDTPVCMGGCSETNEKGVCVVWLLSTNEIVNYRHCVLRHIKKEMKKYKNEYWLIYNFIFKKNHLAKMWLYKLGFAFMELRNIPAGFELFYWKRKLRGLE